VQIIDGSGSCISLMRTIRTTWIISLWIATLSFVWIDPDVVVNGRRVRRRPRPGGLLDFYQRAA